MDFNQYIVYLLYRYTLYCIYQERGVSVDKINKQQEIVQINQLMAILLEEMDEMGLDVDQYEIELLIKNSTTNSFMRANA